MASCPQTAVQVVATLSFIALIVAIPVFFSIRNLMAGESLLSIVPKLSTIVIMSVVVVVAVVLGSAIANSAPCTGVFPSPPVPMQPFVLNATALSGTSIKVFWSGADPTTTGYRIDRESPVDGGFSTIVANTGNNNTSYTDTGLSTGTTYNYLVWAINSGGQTPSDNEFPATTWGVPLAPLGFSASPVSTTSDTLTWATPLSNGGTPITGYKIERQPTCSGAYNILAANTGNTTTSYNDTGLTPNTCYNYRTSAINLIGTGPVSNIDNATTPAVSQTPPGAPTSLSATTLSTTSIKLNWVTPVNGPVTGYKIEKQIGSNGGFGSVTDNTGNTTTHYTITGLVGSTTYQFRTFAINGTGTSSASNIAQNQTLILTVAGPPTGLSATARNSTKIDLSWAAPTNNGNTPITGYKIERQSACAGGYGVLVANTTNTKTTYNNTGLTPSTCYSYRVSAINHIGTSSASNTANATTAALTLPNPPTNLKATTLSTTAIQLAWTAPSGQIRGYKIEKQIGSNGGFGIVTANTTNSTTHYTATSLLSSTQYQFRVSTLNVNGSSIPSAIAGNTTFSPPATTNKFFLALVLQYVNLNTQTNIYSPILDTADFTRLRASNGALGASYVTGVLALNGMHCADYISLADIQNNAQSVKNQGFDCIEYNLESGLSPASDNANVVQSMHNAANAAHAVGLKFRATPSKSYTTSFGPQIAPFSDYYHIQAQSQQTTCGTASDGFKSYVNTEVPLLRAANPSLLISVQESASQGAAPGLTLDQTMETCFSEVANVVNGTGLWFGGSTTSDVQAFVAWFHANYD